MKVLLIDNDRELTEVTAFALRRAGFLVIATSDSETALDVWADEQPALVVLEIQLPKKDGLTLCRELRARDKVPIIILSACNTDNDVVRGLEAGADDYLTKPFSPRQLVARAYAVLRRYQALWQQPTLVVSDLVLDPNYQCAQLPGGMVRLTKLEFRLLYYLVVNQGHVVPTDTILLHVWGFAGVGDRTMVKQLVYRVRQKLADTTFSQVCIETVPGIGYTIARDRAVNSSF
jgi:DNA-binding response OmpR family regulator